MSDDVLSSREAVAAVAQFRAAGWLGSQHELHTDLVGIVEHVPRPISHGRRSCVCRASDLVRYSVVFCACHELDAITPRYRSVSSPWVIAVLR